MACEFSGVVRQAFRARGHDAWSCDLEAAEDGSPYHFEGDIRKVPKHVGEWDMMIGFPPCTDLCSSGARWWPAKIADGRQQRAAVFFLELMRAPIERIAIENPVGAMSTLYRKPDQIIQPWQFGHGETKATCLWLQNLAPLVPTKIVEGRKPRVHFASPGPNRWRERSRTLPGIAEAMASQWAPLAVNH